MQSFTKNTAPPKCYKMNQVAKLMANSHFHDPMNNVSSFKIFIMFGYISETKQLTEITMWLPLHNIGNSNFILNVSFSNSPFIFVSQVLNSTHLSHLNSTHTYMNCTKEGGGINPTQPCPNYITGRYKLALQSWSKWSFLILRLCN